MESDKPACARHRAALQAHSSCVPPASVRGEETGRPGIAGPPIKGSTCQRMTEYKTRDKDLVTKEA